MKKMKKAHAMQPVIWDGKGVVRFQANPIVRFLLDWGSNRGMNLNDLATMSDRMGWKKADWEHFAQLHGYSVSGWGMLSYVRDKTCEKADERVRKLLEKHPTDPALAPELPGDGERP